VFPAFQLDYEYDGHFILEKLRVRNDVINQNREGGQHIHQPGREKNRIFHPFIFSE